MIDLIYKNESHKIIGAAKEVHKILCNRFLLKIISSKCKVPKIQVKIGGWAKTLVTYNSVYVLPSIEVKGPKLQVPRIKTTIGGGG